MSSSQEIMTHLNGQKNDLKRVVFSLVSVRVIRENSLFSM